MPKSLKALVAALVGAGFITGLHRLFDPTQCAAFLNEHTSAIAAGGAILSVVMLWIKSPAEDTK